MIAYLTSVYMITSLFRPKFVSVLDFRMFLKIIRMHNVFEVTEIVTKYIMVLIYFIFVCITENIYGMFVVINFCQ